MQTIEELRSTLKSKFNNLIFDEASHTYVIENQNLLSVTTSLKDFSKPFDEFSMAELVAQKYNKENPTKPPRNALWYRKYWKLKREEASAKGTRVHQYAEQYPNFTESTCEQERGVLEWFNNLNTDIYEVVFMEFRLYCKTIKRAGTLDLLLYNKLTGKLVIADWKTNNTSLLQVYNKTKLKKPFTKLYDTSLNKYSLQLSLYQLMIENNTEFKVEDRWIIWLKDENYLVLDEGKDATKYHVDKVKASVIGKLYKQFNVPYRGEELKKYFDKLETDRLKNPNKKKSKPKSIISSAKIQFLNKVKKLKSNGK